MKISTCSYGMILFAGLLVSCTGYNSQVKCPNPGKIDKRYAKVYHRKNFQVGNKTVNSAYRSFYKKDTRVSNRHNLRADNNQAESALRILTPGFNNTGRKNILASNASHYSENSDKQNISRVIPSENFKESKPEITKREFRKEVKTEVKTLKKEYRELNKLQNSDRKASGFSIASFVIAMVGISSIFFLLPFGILAILLGAIALERYKKNPKEKLKGLAIAAIIIGIAEIPFGIFGLIFLIKLLTSEPDVPGI